MGKRGSISSRIPSPEIKKLPIIPFGNDPHYRKKIPTISSGTPSKTETSQMNKLKLQTKLISKYKESTPLSKYLASSWIST